MKRLVSLYLCLIFLHISVFANFPSATDKNINVSLSLPADDFVIGDTIYVDVKTDIPTSIYAFEAKLKFDNELLEYKTSNINKKLEDDIFEEKENSGEIMLVYSCTGESFSENRNTICTIEFSSLKPGITVVELTSLKVVFSDMTYSLNTNISESINITVKSNEVQITSPIGRPGNGGGGGSRPNGSSSGLSISGGGVTSSGTEVPPTPNLSSEAEEGIKDNTFTDVEQEFWAFDAILNMSKQGIINGFGDGSFKPEQNITRAEFAKIITAGENASESIISFKDVTEDKWYYNCVNTASSMGLINGVGNELFMPDKFITREEAAVVMNRFADFKDKALIPVRLNINFADEDDISDFAVGSIDALYVAGILNGSDNNFFKPKDAITRAEAAYAINDLFKLISGGEK